MTEINGVALASEGSKVLKTPTDTGRSETLNKSIEEVPIIGDLTPVQPTRPAAARTDPREVVIPQQLRRPDMRFILVRPAKKNAMERRWESEANYPYGHTTLTIHCQKGGNYGLFPAPGSSVVIIDADEYTRLIEIGAMDQFPKTFTVESGSSTSERRKVHLYYEIEGEPLVGKRPFLDPTNGEHLGEIFAQHPESSKGYVIGPSSLHPSGERYRVISDVPITRIPREKWEVFAAAVRWNKERSSTREPTKPKMETSGASLAECLNLKVTDFLMPKSVRFQDREYVGAHPVHGSEGGTNLTCTDKVWWCRRHQTGGGALEAFAVAEGIIKCEEAGPNCLKHPSIWRQVIERLREKGYDVDSWIRKKAARATAQRTHSPTEQESNDIGEASPKPTIQVNNRQLREVMADAMTALKNANSPPQIFVRAGVLARIGQDEDGRAVVQTMSEDQVRYHLTHAADFQKTTLHPMRNEQGKHAKDADGKVKVSERSVSVSPPLDMVRTLMADPGITRIFPPLRAILETPSVRSDGGLIITPGYDEISGYYLTLSPGLEVPEIPDDPTPDQIAEAAVLVKEIVCDFPFVDEASRANAIAAIISIVLRPLIGGAVPLMLLDKPQQGTGASLLAELMTLIATGMSAGMSDPPKREEEWAKAILSDLKDGRAVIVYDNLEGQLRSAALASALTADYVNGRVLGRTESIRVPQRAVFIVTGINISLGGDLARRCFWVRMNAKDPRPWLRGAGAFRHPELKKWVRTERGRIIGAILTLARAWIRAERPMDDRIPVLGSFEDWSKTIGGILAYAGIDGFLGNLNQQYEEADADRLQWNAFLKRWYEKWGTEPKTVSEITRQLQEDTEQYNPENTLFGVLPDELMDAFANRLKFNRRMGDALRRRKDMFFDNGLRLEAAGTKNRAVEWQVVKG